MTLLTRPTKSRQVKVAKKKAKNGRVVFSRGLTRGRDVVALSVPKTSRARSKTKAAKARKASIRELRAEVMVGDVYHDGKRVTSGMTIFELLAARRAKKK